jgi:hypothetical protein
MKAFNSSPLENGPAAWSHPSLCRRSRRPKQAARRAQLNRYPDFGFDLTPAFPTPPGGARRRSVAWWEFVARYSGATVPDSHGVPGHLAATAGWRTIPDTFKELGDPAPARPILASTKFSRRKFARAASSSPSSPREERVGRTEEGGIEELDAALKILVRKHLAVPVAGILNMGDQAFTEPEAVAPLTPLAGDFTVEKPASRTRLCPPHAPISSPRNRDNRGPLWPRCSGWLSPHRYSAFRFPEPRTFGGTAFKAECRWPAGRQDREPARECFRS